MTMQKNMTFVYLCCISSNLGTMLPKLLPISTEHEQMNIQKIGQYKGASSNFLMYRVFHNY